MGRKNAPKTQQSQLRFSDSEAWPSTPIPVIRPKSKLMIVLKPHALSASRMHGDADRHSAGQNGREAYPADLLHLTLLCMEQFDRPPQGLIAKTRRALDGVRARPIPISLDRSGLFGGERHLALYGSKGNLHAAQFAHMLTGVLARNNLPHFQVEACTPHVTLIYGCGRIEAMPIERNYAWIAGEFQLVYSHYGETRHEEYGRWSLDPNAEPYPAPSEQFRLRLGSEYRVRS